MSAPRRWRDDPQADETLRELLRTTPGARSLDPATRRRLRLQLGRAVAIPAVAAGWLFVKSAAGALAVVLGTGAVAVATGVVEWSPRPEPTVAVVGSAPRTRAPRAPSAPLVVPAPTVALEVAPEPPLPSLNPAPSLPLVSPSGSGSGTLSAEAALLEQARRELARSPALALSLAADHARRFARGQLAAERTLIQIEALHRLGRDVEARALGRGLLAGVSSGLYAERVHRLLGENLEP